MVQRSGQSLLHPGLHPPDKSLTPELGAFRTPPPLTRNPRRELMPVTLKGNKYLSRLLVASLVLGAIYTWDRLFRIPRFDESLVASSVAEFYQNDALSTGVMELKGAPNESSQVCMLRASYNGDKEGVVKQRSKVWLLPDVEDYAKWQLIYRNEGGILAISQFSVHDIDADLRDVRCLDVSEAVLQKEHQRGASNALPKVILTRRIK